MVSIPQTTKHSKINLEEHINNGRNTNSTIANAPSTSNHKYNQNSFESPVYTFNNSNTRPGQRNIEQNEREQQSNRDGSRQKGSSSALSTLKTQIPTYYMSGLEKYHRVDDTSDYFCKLYREHFIQSVQAMQFCRNLLNKKRVS